jgi:hypothetical protein
LGSLEFDVDEVVARLVKFPNFAVDISARLIDLAIQPTAKVRDFFLNYSDRILFGTDVVMRKRPSAMTSEDREVALNVLRQHYDMHLAYFNDDKEVNIRDRVTTGLGLPSDTLNQFYVKSARTWYPGL